MHAAAEPVQTDSSLHDWRAGSASFRVALVGIAVIAVAIRLFHLNQPMRLDEARTFLDYAIRPLSDAISNYNIPNNHLLHTLLVWLSIRLFGHAEWAVRLPALIAGVLIVPATYVATRALADRGAALIATALAAVLPGLILYTANARGYSMVVLAFVLLIPVANALADEESAGRWLAFGSLMAIGAATIPVMLYPAGVVTLWLLAERLRRHGASSTIRFIPRLAGVLALAGIVTVVAYLPAIQRYGAASISGNKFVTPYSWDPFFRALPRFAERLRQTIALGIPRLLLLGLVLAGLLPLVTRNPARGKLFTLGLTTGFWCIALLVITRRPPPPRVWLFLAPLLCLYAGIGLSWIIGSLSKRFSFAASPAIATAALLLALGIAAGNRRTVFENDESVGLVAGPDIARYLLAEARPGDRLIVGNLVSPEVDYYLFTMGGKRFGDMEAPSRAERVLLIVNETRAQTPATIQAERQDIDWSRYASPVELRQFKAASIWEAPRRPQ
ncbi:MAG: glycosyltransferase family 39 protein [Gemmatimonadaceae bacterium]